MASVRRWDDLIEAGRQLKVMEERVEAEHGNVRWMWGDLALEVAPMGASGSNTGALERLDRFAKELDVSLSALREYRRVAAAWPGAMRVAPEPWGVHALFAGRDDREERIANPHDAETGEKKDRWTFRLAQRALGQKQSPHGYRKPPRTSAEKLAEINNMVATIGDDEAVEFIDGVVDLLTALDERSPRPEPKPPLPLPDRWVNALSQLDRAFTMLAKLAEETDQAGVRLTGHAEMARYLYERLAEKQLDAELRRLLENEGAV